MELLLKNSCKGTLYVSIMSPIQSAGESDITWWKIMLNTLKTQQATKDQFIKEINYCDLCCIYVCCGTAMICAYFLEQYFIVS